MVLHPLGYYPTTLASGKTVDSAGWINRAALGWTSAGLSLAGAETAVMTENNVPFADGRKAVAGGSDITRLSMPAYAADKDADGSPAAAALSRRLPGCRRTTGSSSAPGSSLLTARPRAIPPG